MKKLKWRLSSLPTPSELQGLVNDKIITQEEAREILFSEVDDKEVPVDDLKSEIEFLRQVVEDLSKSKTDKVTVIEKHIKNYPDYTWYQPYYNYCSTGLTDVGCGGSVTLAGTMSTNTMVSNTALTDLKTF